MKTKVNWHNIITCYLLSFALCSILMFAGCPVVIAYLASFLVGAVFPYPLFEKVPTDEPK